MRASVKLLHASSYTVKDRRFRRGVPEVVSDPELLAALEGNDNFSVTPIEEVRVKVEAVEVSTDKPAEEDDPEKEERRPTLRKRSSKKQ